MSETKDLVSGSQQMQLPGWLEDNKHQNKPGMSAHEAVEAEPTVVESTVKHNRNFHPTNLLDVDAHVASTTHSTTTSAGFGGRDSSDAGSARGDGGGRGIFAQALDETTPNRGAAGLLFDVDPRHPNFFLAVAAAVILVIFSTTMCLVYRKGNNRRRRRASRRGSTVGAGSELGAPVSSPVSDVIHNNSTSTPGRRVQTGTPGAEVPPASPRARFSSSGKVRPHTPSRDFPCHTPRDAHSSIVPPFGVDVREFQSEEIERQRNKMKRTKEARKAAKAAAAAAGGSSSSPSPRARSVQARSNRGYRGTSPAAGKGKGKSPARSSRSRTATPSTREKESRREQVESSRAEPMLSPRNVSVKRGGASRPTPSPKGRRTVVKRVAVASEKLSDDMPTTRVLATTTTIIDQRVLSLTPASPESSRERRGITVAAGQEPQNSAASSPLSTPFKREASSLVETARREAQLEADSAAKVRAEKLTGDGAPGPSRRKGSKCADERIHQGDDDHEGDGGKGNTKRDKKRSGAGSSAGAGFSGDSPRKSPRLAKSRPVDKEGRDDGGQRNTKRAAKTTSVENKKLKGDDGARRGTKRTNTSDLAPVQRVKRAKRDN